MRRSFFVLALAPLALAGILFSGIASADVPKCPNGKCPTEDLRRAPASPSSANADPFSPKPRGSTYKPSRNEAKELRKELAEAQAKAHTAELKVARAEGYEDGRSSSHIVLAGILGGVFSCLILGFVLLKLNSKIKELQKVVGSFDQEFKTVTSAIRHRDEELAMLRHKQASAGSR